MLTVFEVKNGIPTKDVKRRLLWCLAILCSLPTLVLLLESLVGEDNLYLLRAECGVGIQSACTLLGVRYSVGRWGVPQDLERAQQLFEAACNAKNGFGCRELADWYSGWRYAGPPTDEAEQRLKALLDRIKDEARAAPLFEKACDAGDGQGCDYLGGVFSQGLGVPENHERAMRAWRRGCEELSNSSACVSLAEAYRASGDEAKARLAYSRSRSGPMPLGFWIWLASFVASLATGIVGVRVNKAGAEGSPRPRRWIVMTAVFASVCVSLGVLQFFSDTGMALVGWVALLIAAAFFAGTFLVWKGRYRAARILLAVVGFLALPLGLFAILVSREVAEFTKPAR